MGNNIYKSVEHEKNNEIIHLVKEGYYGNAIHKIQELPLEEKEILLRFSDDLEDFFCGWICGDVCCNESGFTCCGIGIAIIACIGNGGDCGCCSFITNNICGC